jgi:Na+-driven multidrug efflux pump
MERILRALKTVNYRLLLAILTIMLLPTLYQTVRIFFLGDMPGDWGFNIASQLAWVDLFYEVVQEALILPLFFLLGKSLTKESKPDENFENKVRTGLIATAAIYLCLSIVVIIFARQMVVFMAQEAVLVDATVGYIRLETIAALFSTLSRFIMLVLLTMKKDKYMYITLGVQMIMSIILDIFLISNLSVSAKIGVNGIAISNIIVNISILIIAIMLLNKENIKFFRKRKLSFAWMKEWFHIGKFSGLESLLRNLAFIIMIIRMVNVVSEQGNYWVANNFIWGWLLLPGLALADLVKKEVAEDEKNIRTKTFGYIVLTSIFAIIWLLTIPLWKPFIHHAMNITEYETVFYIAIMQTAFYLTFLFNSCICDSTFYGLGRTDYMLLQSICIDVVYYGIMFILYVTGIFVPTLLSISLMSGIGMTLDFIPTLILYRIMLKKKGIQIDFKLAQES